MFCLKKNLMKLIIDKKKKKNQFDYVKSEAYTVGTDGDGTQNNSYYFSAHSYEKNESLYTRLALRDDGSAEVWAYYNKDDKIYYHPHLIYNKDNSPLKVVKTDRGWDFSFVGILVDENGKEFNSEINCAYTSDNNAVDFFFNMPSERVCTAMAQDKWNKEYFAEVQKNNSTHYEQGGNITGSIKIGKTTSEIDLPCLRDHAFGRRVWGYMNNHLWLAGIDKNCLFNFSMVSYPAMSVLEVGHLTENDNPVEYVINAHYDRYAIIKDKVPNYLALELKTNTRRTIWVYAKLLHAKTYEFENGDYRLIEGIAEFEFDGIKCRGILEVGFNKDKSRFLNGKQIAKIRE